MVLRGGQFYYERGTPAKVLTHLAEVEVGVGVEGGLSRAERELVRRIALVHLGPFLVSKLCFLAVTW